MKRKKGNGFVKTRKHEDFIGSVIVNAFTPANAPEGHGLIKDMSWTGRTLSLDAIFQNKSGYTSQE